MIISANVRDSGLDLSEQKVIRNSFLFGIPVPRVIYFSQQRISPNYVVLRLILKSICIPGATAASRREKGTPEASGLERSQLGISKVPTLEAVFDQSLSPPQAPRERVRPGSSAVCKRTAGRRSGQKAARWGEPEGRSGHDTAHVWGRSSCVVGGALCSAAPLASTH